MFTVALSLPKLAPTTPTELDLVHHNDDAIPKHGYTRDCHTHMCVIIHILGP